MRTTILFSITFIAYIASAVPVNDEIGEKVYSRYIEFPDGDGITHTVDLEAEPDQEILREVTRNPANNAYFLFTRRNPWNSQTLTMNNANSIHDSNYDSSKDTVVIAHGWLSNQNTDINPTIRDAYLGRFDVNVIVVDWRRLARADYVTAVLGVPAVGRGVGQFIKFLISTAGGSLDRFHIIGFSLGAHLVGSTGRELGGRAARITGLDPAGPLWSYNSNRLSENDGVYVEAIHTNGGIAGLGIGSAIAHADFFPNGGTSQPGCLTPICDHGRAWEMFAATVAYDHLIGQQCNNNLQVVLNNCRGSSLHMGNSHLGKAGRGMFRVNTGRRYPF